LLRKWGVLIAGGIVLLLLAFGIGRLVMSGNGRADDRAEAETHEAEAPPPPDGAVDTDSAPDTTEDETSDATNNATSNPKQGSSASESGEEGTDSVDGALDADGSAVGADPTEPASVDDPISDPDESSALPDAEPTVDDVPVDDTPFDASPAGPPFESAVIPPIVLPEDPTGGRPAPTQVDVSTRLRDPITGFEFPEISLKAFLEFVSDFSTIPITLDPDSMRRAGVTPDVTVSVLAQETTVDTMLANVLGKHRLAYRELPGHLRVVNDDTALSRVRLDVADLVADNATTLTDVADAIRDVAGRGTWKENGGQAELEVANGAIVLIHDGSGIFAAVELCERLRTARGLPLRSKRHPSSFFHTETRSSQAAAALATTIESNFNRPTPLRRILKHLEDQAHVKILVDWQELAAAHWARPAETKLSVDDVPLAETLDTLLGPMDLAYRVVDGTTLQITTPHALHGHTELELYPVHDLLRRGYRAEELVKRLQQALGAGMFVDPESAATLRFDAASKHLVVRLQQSYQRQLEALLARWRAG
jgi:hypothetical protein